MPLPRRTFLKTSLAAGVLASSARLLGANSTNHADREYYELRAYRLRQDGARELLDRYLSTALIPALKQRGLGPIGAFNETSANPTTAHLPSVWLVIPHPNLNSFVEVATQLNADATVQNAAGAYFSETRKTPAFDRIDSWLSLAFAGQPKLKLPVAHANSGRVFELRTYESPSEERALAKVDMFNSGEIPVMHEVGLSPVFFGQTLVGQGIPHLMYMTSGADMDAHKEHWKAFSAHPQWIKLKNDPKYADTVNKMIQRFLTPTEYSEV